MIKTRFAPSPTGFLHIGSVRTALYSWLYARRHQGQFVLRIEDTDQTRSTQASVDIILEAMAWLGLDYDEPPVYQLERLARHQHFVEKLLADDKAYRCDCSKERLTQLRNEQIAAKQKARYDGHCRNRTVSAEKLHVIRFRNPEQGSVTFEDAVYGVITVNNTELDDLILVRSEGVPTYNLSVVIDDWEMGITHVIRGEDHLNNTPRQINLLNALGAPIPKYAHLPSILGSDGKRLSKRHGAENVLNYRDRGYMPAAFLNYLARLGWSHGDQEILSIDELKQHFAFDHVHRSGATYDLNKLTWVNQHYLKNHTPEAIKAWLLERDPRFEPLTLSAIELLKPRAHIFQDFLEKADYFIQAPTVYQAEAVQQFITDDGLKHLRAIRDLLENCEWTAELIRHLMKAYAKENDLKFPMIAQPLRIAVSGNTETPAINEVLFILGREAVLDRIDKLLGERD